MGVDIMALKTNQMQTDLKKYREEYDRIFSKKEKIDPLTDIYTHIAKKFAEKVDEDILEMYKEQNNESSD
mgnify:CR=1 FL=1